MKQLRVQPHGEKHIRVSGVDLFLALCLQEIPEILSRRDSPAVHNRLFPLPTTTDNKANEDWQQFVIPELRHLLVSAGETMARDLTGLTGEDGRPGSFEITFPTSHLAAWMSAINQTRLILGELFEINEQDLHNPELDVADPKLRAVMKIEWLGMLLYRLVQLQLGETEPQDAADPGATDPQPKKRPSPRRGKKSPEP